MDLYEYIMKKKTADPKFKQGSIAKKIGIARENFSKIVHHKVVPSARVARAIEEATNGEVCGWELIKKALDKRDKHDNDSSKFTSSDNAVLQPTAFRSSELSVVKGGDGNHTTSEQED